MKIHDRARFFDPRLWNNRDSKIDDNDRFFVPATVVNVYLDGDREVVDLRFDHCPDKISKGHFSDIVKPYPERFVLARDVQKGDIINIGGMWMYVVDNFIINDGSVGICYLFRDSGLAGHLIAPNALLILTKED